MHPLAPLWFAVGFAGCDLTDFLVNLICGRPAQLRPWLTVVGAFCLGLLIGTW
jgi:hypothetical protein